MTENTANQVAADNDDVLDIFTEFAVEDDGVWVPYKGDIEFLIARAGNAKFRRRLSYFYEKNRRLLDGKSEAAEKKSNEVLATVMAETILLGWKGKVAIQGELVQYSKANAERLLSIQMFREWVTAQSQDQHAYKVVKDEEDKENL